ncbi:MAG: glycosyltransferase [Chloroflexi bacterium]|nr:glycosyltransferase [Chloroflexota bacterium]
MKIALLSEKYTPDIGGLAISVGRLGHLLASAGHDVRVFAPTPSTTLRTDLGLLPSERRTYAAGGVRVTRFGAHKRVDDTLVDWFELIAEEHRREPFDLLQGYFLPQAGFVTVYAGKYLKLPSVVSIRGNDIERAAFDPSRFSHVMYALQHADAVTTNASELARKAKAFVERDIVWIPNGIDTEQFRPLPRNEALAEALGLYSSVTLSAATLAPGAHLPWRSVPGSAGEGLGDNQRGSSVAANALPQSDTTIMGFVGELREKKGLRALLHGYAQVNKQHPTTLLVVGEVRAGEDRQIFDEFRSANPDARIIVTGYVTHEDLPAYYALMDVFVHPSLRDGMPNAVLEAMACGKTVIATAVGGVTDVIQDGVDGLLIPAHDAGRLGAIIVEALDQPEKRDQLGRSARETVLRRFTLEKELQANWTVYQNLGVNQ